MTSTNPIRTIIIDDNAEAIETLNGFLELMPEIELLGTANNYQKALKIIKEKTPDLVFLDIELPGKSGFELLEQFDQEMGRRSFDVIFYTAYDQYTIKALRESAFDFILKPLKEDELKNAIERYKTQKKKSPTPNQSPISERIKQMIAVPTHTGLQFICRNDIVFAECHKAALNLRSAWQITLTDHQIIKLRQNTNAEVLQKHLGIDTFIQLSQSVLVNLHFVNSIEYKTHLCYLFPPFDTSPLKISRQFMAELKGRFDVI
jgi:two-component system LytT family response regulator